MAVSRNPLVHDLLEIAEGLAGQDGRPSLRQAGLRRAVSTAYYALFHALCTVCADGLVRWSRTDLVAKTYRSLDHGLARRKLAALAAKADKGAVVRRIGVVFGDLQDSRNDADYERPMVLFSRSEAMVLIGQAREAVELLAALDEDARRRLAVELLVAKAR